MRSPIFRASSAFARASAGRGYPRSANTLPLPTTCFFFAIVLLLAFADRDGLFQPALDWLDLRLWCRDAVLRLLLERVEDLDVARQAHRVDGAEGVAAVVGDHLQDARAKPLQRLGRDVLPAALCKEQGVADLVLHP